MAGPYNISLPVPGQPASSSLFGIPVKEAIEDLDDRALTLEQGQQAIVARGRRTTVKSVAAGSAGTEWGFMRLDNIPVKNGNGYRLMTSGVNLDTDVANDVLQARLRVAYAATPGTQATTASAQIASVRQTQVNASQSFLIPMSGFYFATADGFISVIATGHRVVGTGSVQLFASGTELFDLTVEFAGPVPADTAVLL